MGQRIDLANIPNQDFTVEAGGQTYQLKFFTSGDVLTVTIIRDNILLFDNIRVVNGTPLIPYRLTATGNFIFIATDEQLPNYKNFGTTQVLYFMTEEEIAAVS